MHLQNSSPRTNLFSIRWPKLSLEFLRIVDGWRREKWTHRGTQRSEPHRQSYLAGTARPQIWRVQQQQMSIDVEGEFDESSVNEAADSAVRRRLIALHLRGQRELIDDPEPASVFLAASDFGGHGAVREPR